MTTGRVFHRSSLPDPLVAVRAEGSTIWAADGRAYLDAAGGAIVVNVGHGRREIAAAMADQASPRRVCPRQCLHVRAAGALCRGRREAPAARRPGDLPGVGWLGGHRDGDQARQDLPRRPRRVGSVDRLRAMGQLPRQHARRPGPVRSQAAPPPVRRLAGPVPASLRGLSVPRRATLVPTPWPRARSSRASSRRPSRPPARDGRGVRGGADRRRHAGGRRPARRLLAEDRRGLPATRRAAHRRRGHDRIRTDRSLVRRRPLGRSEPDLLVAAKGATSGYWPFGFAAASERSTTAVAAGPGSSHGFTYSHGPVAAAVGQRGPADPGGRGPHRGQRDARATGSESELVAALGGHPNVGDIRGRGLLVGLELVADRQSRAPFPRRPD